jgi:putative ABC transport system permease protein
MWKNYLKIALRSIGKNRFVSFINIAGLGIGLTAGVFVLLYIQHELSYDKWITDQDNIYRVYRLWGNKGGHTYIPGPAAAAARAEIPEIRSATRVNTNSDLLVEWNQQHYTIPSVAYVDSAFFRTIPLELALGQPQNAFSKLNTAVLSADMAGKIFGDTDPIGETLLLDNEDLVEVSGVLKPFPGPSHFRADIILHQEVPTSSWTGASGRVYVRLHEASGAEVVAQKFYDIALREIKKEYQAEGESVDQNRLANWYLQPLANIHLGSQSIGEDGPSSGSYRQIGIMILLGVMVILLAVINYINLTTAQMTRKASEIGIRKVIGASRKQLNRQFVVESFVHVVLALIIAIGVVQLVLPYFNETVSRIMSMSELFSSQGVLALAAIVLLLSFMAGLFPAYYFSSIDPAETIKNQLSRGKGSVGFRNAMVVFQFALSVGLIIFVSLIWMQVRFMLTKELGFAGDQIAIFQINQAETEAVFEQKKSGLLAIPGVKAVSRLSRPPGGFVPNYSYRMQGRENMTSVNTLFVDADWNQAFELPVLEGRFFTKERPVDTLRSFVVNQQFVDFFEIEDPIGYQIKFPGDEPQGEVIGVVEDFHYEGLQNTIEPLVISARPDMAWMRNVAVSMGAENISATLSQVQDYWKVMEPVFPVNYRFIDDSFAEQYEAYFRFGKSMLYTTIFCIFISLLGLFGLTTFVIQQRTKEIGIRRILGASIQNIIGLLSKDFLKLVLIAIVVASPVAWYFASRWLENFAYQISVEWWVFAGVGLLALLLAFLTVSLQTIQAAASNPVNSLRSE